MIKRYSRWFRIVLWAGLIFSPVAHASTTAVMALSPNVMPRGSVSTLTISFANNADTAVTINSSNTLTLPSAPAGLFYTGVPSSTCTGLTPVINPGNTDLSFTGTGSVPANGSCTITASVTSDSIANYDVPFTANFFVASDGSQLPSVDSPQTLSVTPYQPVSIVLKSTRGTTQTPTTTTIINSNQSIDLQDLTTARLTRFRYVLTNPNPIALTNVNLTWPSLPSTILSVIPNSLLSDSLVTDTSAGAAAGCGGTLTLSAPGLLLTNQDRPTLSGATIPANGSCEVSYWVRADSAFAINISGTIGFNYDLGAGLLSSDQGVSNAATNNPLQSYATAQYTRSTLNAASSGFTGDSFNVTLTLANSNSSNVTIKTGGNTGWIWDIGQGIEPNITTTITPANCPSLTPASWNATTRQLTIQGTFSAGGCNYTVPFISSYAGPDTSTIATIAPAGNVQYVMPSGAETPSNRTMNTHSASFQAFNGQSTSAAVTVSAKVFDYLGAAMVGGQPTGSAHTIELTLTAPQGVSNYELTGRWSDIVNAWTPFSYIPAATNNCGATMNIPDGGASFNLSNVNLNSGETCVVRLPVLYRRDVVGALNINAGEAFGTVNGTIEYTPVSRYSLFTYSGSTIEFEQSFIPAAVIPNSPNTIYTVTLNKKQKISPIEKLDFNVNLNTPSGGVDLGLRATQIVSNTCNATINGVAPGIYPLPLPNVTALSITNASTPDSIAQGAGPYDNSTGFDARAFDASSCQIQVQVEPDPAKLALVTNTVTSQIIGLGGGRYISNTNQDLAQFYSFFPVPNNPSYTVVTDTPSQITQSLLFNPTSVAVGQETRMSILIDNRLGNAVGLTNATLTNDYIRDAGGHLMNTSTPNPQISGTGCTGTLTAWPHGRFISLSNAYIPAGSVCTISVNVLPTAINVNNILPQNAFTSTQSNDSTGPASASVALNASFGAVTTFNPTMLDYNPLLPSANTSTLTLSLINSFPGVATLAPYTHTLPANLEIAGHIGFAGAGCSVNILGGGASGTNYLSIAGSIPSMSSCTFTIPVQVISAPAVVPPAVSLIYTDTIPANTMNVHINSIVPNITTNLVEANATLTVTAPATITISKTVSGQTISKPVGATYPVTLTCTSSGTFNLNATELLPTSQVVIAGDTCTVSEPSATLPAPLPGYAWGATTITPAASFTAVAGNNPINIDNALTFDVPRNISASALFNPALAGGTLPVLSLTCNPAASEITTGSAWTAPTGASCTLNASGGVAPAGYALGSTTYSGNGINSTTGAFTVSSTDLSFTSTTTLVATPQNATVISNTFNPAIAGSLPPTLTLNCSPAATGSYPNFSAPTGASCAIEISASAPEGYSIGNSTFGGTGVDPIAGTFTMPAGGINNLTVTTTLTANAQTLTVTSAFEPDIAGGTVPTATLLCTPAATEVVAGSEWTAPTDASCTLSTSGGTAPSGYTLGDVTFGGTGINTSTGIFTVPATNLSLTSTTTLITELQLVTTISSDAVSFEFPTTRTLRSTGILPTITLNCTPAATSIIEGESWDIPTGSSCTMSLIGGTPPSGYVFDHVTYSGTGVNPTTGTFLVPAGGISNLAAVMHLRAFGAGNVESIPAITLWASLMGIFSVLGVAYSRHLRKLHNRLSQ